MLVHVHEWEMNLNDALNDLSPWSRSSSHEYMEVGDAACGSTGYRGCIRLDSAALQARYSEQQIQQLKSNICAYLFLFGSRDFLLKVQHQRSTLLKPRHPSLFYRIQPFAMISYVSRPKRHFIWCLSRYCCKQKRAWTIWYIAFQTSIPDQWDVVCYIVSFYLRFPGGYPQDL